MKRSKLEKYNQFLVEEGSQYTLNELAQKLGIKKTTVQSYLAKRNIPFKKTVNKYKDKNGLTKQELKVLELLSEGLSDSEIASKLFISIHTMKTHKDKIYGKAKMYGTDKGSMRLKVALWYYKQYKNGVIT